MSSERFGGLRARIAAEAARLMYEESVSQYFTAKRIAARHLLGKVAGKRMRYQPADLPSNGEIRDALLLLASRAEGSRRTRRLFAMRIIALEAMEKLEPFAPRLIGSVSTGHIRRGSDVDIQVFTDDEDRLADHLRSLDWIFETERVSIQKGGEIRDYLHHQVADTFPVELTVYPRRDLRFRPRSSTDGKPIVRVTSAALRALLLREHAEPWARYLEDGCIDGLDDAIADEGDETPPPGPFDSFLGDGGDEPLATAEPGEEDDPDQAYDPLPGFAAVA